MVRILSTGPRAFNSVPKLHTSTLAKATHRPFFFVNWIEKKKDDYRHCIYKAIWDIMTQEKNFSHSSLWVTLPKRHYLVLLLENLRMWEAWFVLMAVLCYAALGKLPNELLCFIWSDWNEIILHFGWHAIVTDLRQRTLSFLALIFLECCCLWKWQCFVSPILLTSQVLC